MVKGGTMFNKIVNKRNLFIINGFIMILMGILWLMSLNTKDSQYSMLYYDIRPYAELAIILLLGVMLMDRLKASNISRTIMFLVFFFVGIIVANNQISLFEFSSLEKEWLYRSIAFISIYLALIVLLALEIDFKKLWHHKKEMLIIISLIGIIISWSFTAYKSAYYISSKPIQSYLDLVNYYLRINRVSTQ
jgi:hypothetical protein